MVKIIALCGAAGSGKSTLRKHIVRKYGYEWLSFAKSLKDMLVAFVYSQGCPHHHAERMFFGDLKEQPSEYLGGRTPRHAMQIIGSEWRDMMSKTLYSDAWKRAVIRRGLSKVVVDDLRFLHEEHMLRNSPEFNTTIISITRLPRRYQDEFHESEIEYLTILPNTYILNEEGNPVKMLDAFDSLIGYKLEKQK